MKNLAKEIFRIMHEEYGSKTILERLENPYWFQCLSCVLGFDWHSSGTTTVTIGALKEALAEADIGIKVAGGKGSISRKTPQELCNICKKFDLEAEDYIMLSKAAAKLDSAIIQDGFQLYHHSFFLDENGNWLVIQQGLNPQSRYARRYHIKDKNLLKKFAKENFQHICSDEKKNKILDLNTKQSRDAKELIVELIQEKKLNRHKHLIMGKGLNWKTVEKLYKLEPQNFSELALAYGVGPKTLRCLALIAKLIYGKEVFWKDPAAYSFAVGGKDGVPFPVDKKVMDQAIFELKNAVEQAKISKKEKLNSIKRLTNFTIPKFT